MASVLGYYFLKWLLPGLQRAREHPLAEGKDEQWCWKSKRDSGLNEVQCGTPATTAWKVICMSDWRCINRAVSLWFHG